MAIFRRIGDLSMINIDGLVREGNKYKDTHHSKPSALRLPVKTIGAIKAFVPFSRTATKFSLVPRLPDFSPQIFFLFLTSHKRSLETAQILIHQQEPDFDFPIL